MPRKRIQQRETVGYDKAFPKRLRALMAEKHITQQTLGDHLEKSRQSIAAYCDGTSSPDWETIVEIARYFSVSCDYLLGLSDTPTVEQDIKVACKTTGLSTNAVKSIQYKCLGDRGRTNYADILSIILTSKKLNKLLLYILAAMGCKQADAHYSLDDTPQLDNFTGQDILKAHEAIRYSNQIVLECSEAERFYYHECLDIFGEILNEDVLKSVD